MIWEKDRNGHFVDNKYLPHYLIVRHNTKDFEVMFRGDKDKGWTKIGQRGSLKTAKSCAEQHQKNHVSLP
jgi:hypothetical protein